MGKSKYMQCAAVILGTLIMLMLVGCTKTKEIPFDRSSVIGTEYKKVVEELEAVGFSNIQAETTDVVDEEEDNKVKDIYFDGKTDFKKGKKVSENVSIKITYNKLLQIEPYLNIQFEGENEEPEIVVYTNLPNDVKLNVYVSCEQKEYKKEKQAKVQSGKAITKWGGLGDSWTPGKYKVTVEMRLKDQSERALSEIGHKGDILTGEKVQVNNENGEKYLCEESEYEVDEEQFLQKYTTGDKRTLYLVEKAVQEKYGMQYTITKEYTGLTNINIWNEAYNQKYIAAQTGDIDALREWYKVRKEVTAFASELQNTAPLYWIWVNIVQQDEGKTPILKVTDDVVEYDALRKDAPIRANKSNVDYIGMIGYVALEDYPDYGAYNPNDDKKFAESEWTVPSYQKDKQFYVKNGAIAHKTKVQVTNQDVTDKGHYYGVGYLTVRDLNTGDDYIINMHNFVTLPYWELDTETAVSIGKCVAEYHQQSDYWPVPISKQERAKEGVKVLAISEKNHKIIGLVYQNNDWIKYEFQPEDLTIIK